MRPHIVLVCLSLVGLALAGVLPLLAAPGTSARDAEAWATTVVTRISEADRPENGRGGRVVIRIRIAADGSLDGVSLDESSGSAETDERALRAVRAAAPFRSPPRRLVTLEGYTELSFALQLDPAKPR